MFAVEMYNITKTFGDNFKANDSVTLKILKGEIHAIVGENGAGKSTLMKILYGMYHPDEGKILLEGKETAINSPLTAINNKIGMVHQHFMLIGPLTALENIILGDETTKSFDIIDFKKCRDKVNLLTNSFSINIDLNQKVESLPVGAQQKIEILKVLYRNAEILILDEPTAVLTPQETDELFNTLKELKENGKTIILITHKLSEVLSISDKVTILRHGRKVGTVDSKLTDKNELARMIVGEELELTKSKENTASNESILIIQNLTLKNDAGIEAVKDLSIKIHKGEILGIAGVEGNGQVELVEAINGLRKYEHGTITVNNKKLNKNYPVAHIPADRLKNGIVAEYSIAKNIILGRENEPKFSSKFRLKNDEINNFTEELIKAYDVRTIGLEQPINGLSGGNQQKVVAAREITKDTDLMIACHPTRGLDIKAANFLHNTLLTESKKGKAVLLVSSDLSELLKLSDKIAVMYNGKITALLYARNTNEHEIGLHMTGFQSDNRKN